MFDPAVVNEGLGQAAQLSGSQGSPDGLGAYVVPDPGDQNYPYPDPTESSPNPPPVFSSRHHQASYQPVPQYGMQGEIDFLEPEDTSGGAATRSAGFTLLFVALGTGIGYAWKGGLGAAAGLLLCGGAANAYRAQKWFDSGEPSEKHEAMVSTIFAAGELGTGAYVAYKAFQLGESGLKKKR